MSANRNSIIFTHLSQCNVSFIDAMFTIWACIILFLNCKMFGLQNGISGKIHWVTQVKENIKMQFINNILLILGTVNTFKKIIFRYNFSPTSLVCKHWMLNSYYINFVVKYLFASNGKFKFYNILRKKHIAFVFTFNA